MVKLPNEGRLGGITSQLSALDLAMKAAADTARQERLLLKQLIHSSLHSLGRW